MMRNKEVSVKKSILQSYIMISFVPMLLLIIMFLVYSVSLYRQSEKQNALVQQQVASNVYDVIHESRQICSNIYSAIDFDKVLKLKSIEQFFGSKEVNTAINYLGSFKDNSRAAEEIYLYLEKPDVIISVQGVLDSQAYFDINLKSSDLTYEAWIEQLKMQNNEDYTLLENAKKGYIDYHYNMVRAPFFLFDYDTNVTLSVTVLQSEYFRNIDDLSLFTNCNMYIFDDDNKLLFSRIENESENINPKKIEDITGNYKANNVIQTTFVSNETSKWTIVTVIDGYNSVKNPMYVLFLGMVIIFVCLILLAGMIFRITRKNYNPIEKIISIIGEAGQRNEFNLIESSIKQLMKTKDEHAEIIEQQNWSLKELVLIALLNGNLGSDIASKLQSCDIAFKHENYIVLTFQAVAFDNSDFEQEKRLIFKNSLFEIIKNMFEPMNGAAYCVEENECFVCIINTSESGKPYLRQLRRVLLEYAGLLCDEFNVIIEAAVSNIHNSYSKISKAYYETIETLSYAQPYKTEVYLYGELSDFRRLYFSLQQENAIVNGFQAGSFSAVKKVLDNVFDDINILNIKYAQPIMYDIACAFLKLPHIIDLSKDKELVNEITFSNFCVNIENVGGFIDFTYDIAERICQNVNHNKTSSRSRISDEFILYIKNNYMNPNLTVSSIASSLNISSSTLTKIVSQNCGATIIGYLQKYRISVSQKMLEENMKIESVWKETGFSSARTFNRVFKDTVGVSPSNYRAAKVK